MTGSSTEGIAQRFSASNQECESVVCSSALQPTNRGPKSLVWFGSLAFPILECAQTHAEFCRQSRLRKA